MNLETIDELMETLKDSHKADFPSILQECINYGFIEDIEVAELFEIEFEDLDELLYSADHVAATKWKDMARKLYSFLKKEKKKYSHLYYRQVSAR